MQKISLILSLILIISLSSFSVNSSICLTSKNGMVSSASIYASEIGAQILENGGNAIDAAVAVSLALGVAEPYASGIGGEGYAIISLANGKDYFLDFKSVAPEMANYDYIKSLGIDSLSEIKYTAKAAMVPGVLAGIEKALEIGGTLPLSKLIEPSISLAKNGFIVNKTFSKTTGDKYELLLENAEDFLNDYLVWEEGEVFTNPALAETYEEISKNGIKSFYTGKIAESIENIMKETDGFIRKKDLGNYKAIYGNPLSGTYRGYEIVAPQQPVSGAEIISIMNILENFNICSFSEYDPLLIHIIYQSIMLESIDSYHFLGDPYFNNLPTKGWISKEYAKSRLKYINFDSFITTEEYKKMTGNPGSYAENESYTDVALNKANGFSEEYLENESHHSTTHFSIVDKFGNAVSWTQTLSSFFGCGTYVDGFFLNNEIWNFSIDKDIENTWVIEPGKRPATTIAPIIVKKDCKVKYVIGTPGGERIVPTVIQILVDLIDFGKTVEQAVTSPKFSSFIGYDTVNFESSFPEKTVKYLEKCLGYPVNIKDYPDLYFGGPNIISIDKDFNITGMGSVRRNGFSAAPIF